MPDDTPPPDEPRTITATFGTSETQPAPWTDRRSMLWPELATLLTTHAIGPKEGACIVPATFRGNERKQSAGERIDLILLDSDSGAPLEEIAAAIARHGWAASIASTHSHLNTTTRARRGAYEKWLADAGIALTDPAGPAAYLISFKGMLTRLAEQARITEQHSTDVAFGHAPCPRYRIALPLARPWIAAAFNTSKEAIAAWKGAYAALAYALDLRHDASCADVSRLFYLPRRPADGPSPETLILAGAWVDIFALPPAPVPAGRRRKAERPGSRDQRAQAQQGKGNAAHGASGFNFGSDQSEPIEFTDPQTGETLNLVRWAAKSGAYFQLVNALQARRPDIFVGKVGDGVRHHITCPNAAAHTDPDPDHATFVTNAGQGEGKGFVIHCRHDHCTDCDRLLMLRQMLEQGSLKVEDLHNPLFQPGAPPPKPVIRLGHGVLPETVQQAEAALMMGKPTIFQRGSLLVRPGRLRHGVDDNGGRSSLQIVEVEDHALAEAMTVAATWQRFDARTNEWTDVDAPTKVATVLRQRKGLWRLPVLTAILTAPTLRADGSVLEQPGYDAATGLLLARPRVPFPPVPNRPSREDARQALGKLQDLVATFPFVDEASRSVALSGLLTSVIRRSLRTAPLHGYTAPVAGSGKSMLVDLASLIATGRVAGVIAQGRTEEELEKRLGALLLAGDQVIAIDNCEAPLGGEFLCSLLTQETVRCRILGRSEAPELPSNSFVTATGNNLTLVGDMTRRTLLCQLDPQTERPELRRFDRDPVAEARDRRPELLVAALTVLRAYHVASRPDAPDPLGSFETWSGWVRGALIWLGCADPVLTLEVVREQDPKLDALTAVLSQWHRHIGVREVTSREIIEVATAQVTVAGGSLHFPKMEFRHPDFREALLVIAGENGVVNSRRLGSWIGRHRGRQVDGLRLARAPLLDGQQQWKLEPVAQPERAAAA